MFHLTPLTSLAIPSKPLSHLSAYSFSTFHSFAHLNYLANHLSIYPSAYLSSIHIPYIHLLICLLLLDHYLAPNPPPTHIPSTNSLISLLSTTHLFICPPLVHLSSFSLIPCIYASVFHPYNTHLCIFPLFDHPLIHRFIHGPTIHSSIHYPLICLSTVHLSFFHTSHNYP